MKQFLVVVDMQKDFVDGSLGTPEAQAIVSRAAEKIRSFEGDIFVTYDTHFEDYLDTPEGKKLPVPHCIYETPGWELTEELQDLMEMQGNPPETLEDFVRLHMKAAVRQSAVNPPVRELESENSAEDRRSYS